MDSLELEGFDQLMKKIEDMGRAGTRIENTALKKAGEVILEEAKNNVPEITGKLKKGLKVSGIRSKDNRKYVLVGIQRGDNSDIFYGKFIEFGASPHLIKIMKGRFKGAVLNHPGVVKKPFLGPAYESKKEEAKEIIKQELKNALNLK